MNNQVKIFLSVIVILILGTIVSVVMRTTATPPGPGKYDTFASCLKEKGAVFYGAFWCPHCASQKKLFGSSVKLLPYVECSTADTNGQAQACIDKKITGYPTWEFADNSRLNGEIPLQQLADKTGCALPAGDTLIAPIDTGASKSIKE